MSVCVYVVSRYIMADISLDNTCLTTPFNHKGQTWKATYNACYCNAHAWTHKVIFSSAFIFELSFPLSPSLTLFVWFCPPFFLPLSTHSSLPCLLTSSLSSTLHLSPLTLFLFCLLSPLVFPYSPAPPPLPCPRLPCSSLVCPLPVMLVLYFSLFPSFTFLPLLTPSLSFSPSFFDDLFFSKETHLPHHPPSFPPLLSLDT